jgi:hypothetical protein
MKVPLIPRPQLGTKFQQVKGDVWADFMPDGVPTTIVYNGSLKGHIDLDGAYWLFFDSRTLVHDFMQKSDKLTEQILEHWRAYERRVNPNHKETTLTYLENWINVHPFRSWGKKPIYPAGRENWSTGQYESGNTMNFGDECWIGDVFTFAHFYMDPGEGAIILWHRGGDVRGNYEEPEVWLGDFEGFMNTQNWCEWSDADGFLTWNETLGGGFMWALQKMGSFDDPEIDLNPVIWEAMIKDPKIAYDPVDIGVLKNERAFPHEVVQAVKEYGAKHARR